MDQKRSVKIHKRERVHDGFFKLDRLELTHERFDGTFSPPLIREVVIQRRAAAILPYCPSTDQVLLVQQFRPTLIYAPDNNAWLIEAPAGLAEDDENIEKVARREAFEETGADIGRLIRALSYRATPGCSTELADVFIGELTSLPETGLHGVEGEGEDIKTILMPRREAMERLYRAEITAATAVTSLLYLSLHEEAIRKKWLGR